MRCRYGFRIYLFPTHGLSLSASTALPALKCPASCRKYEIYYEIEGTRRYFIEDAAYIVNAGSVVLIGDNQIHKTASVGDTPSSRIVLNFSAESVGKIAEIFPEVDFFLPSEEHNHLLSNITVKQQNHIYSMLQQFLELQEQTSAEGEAVRKMLLATLLLELKDLCKQQQAPGRRKRPRQQPYRGADSDLYRRALRGKTDPRACAPA